MKLPWFDLLPDDSRVEAKAVSGHRHLLVEVVEEEDGTASEPSDRRRECRSCGTELSNQAYCPRCESEDIAVDECE